MAESFIYRDRFEYYLQCILIMFTVYKILHPAFFHPARNMINVDMATDDGLVANGRLA